MNFEYFVDNTCIHYFTCVLELTIRGFCLFNIRLSLDSIILWIIHVYITVPVYLN